MNKDDKKAAMRAASSGARSSALNQAMTVVKNGGQDQLINFVVEEFYLAARIMKRCSENHTKPYHLLPEGLRLFVHQQIFRLNSAAMVLDGLGFQSITEIMVALHPDMDRYMRDTMRGWNEIIEAEGEVERIFEEIKKEEENAGNPVATMQ